MSAQFELQKSKNGKYFFNLLATNGEIILTSQMYASITGARKGITSVQSNSRNANLYERRQGKKGKSHFVLKSGNHRVIGTSQTYSSKVAMEGGIKAVLKNGKVKKTVIA
jgi:uncharacterized protein YegP (UPF0339 family)